MVEQGSFERDVFSFHSFIQDGQRQNDIQLLPPIQGISALLGMVYALERQNSIEYDQGSSKNVTSITIMIAMQSLTLSDSVQCS